MATKRLRVPPNKIVLSPTDRFALVGKTGSGKSSFEILLAEKLIEHQKPPWAVWDVDTKNDPKDLERLQKWGYTTPSRKEDPSSPARKLLLKVRGDDEEIVRKAQLIFNTSLTRGDVIVCVDEYTHVISSPRRAGVGLGKIFRTGRGLHVGLIGCTQEPVDIPRQLLSQASHLFLFNITHSNDIDYLRKHLFRTYIPPVEQYGDIHGFWHKWIDGPNPQWTYYSGQQEWYDIVKVGK